MFLLRWDECKQAHASGMDGLGAPQFLQSKHTLSEHFPVRIIDADVFFRTELAKMLRMLGFDTARLPPPKRSLPPMQQNGPAAFYRCRITRMSGVELCRYRRATNRNTPFIMITASTDVTSGLVNACGSKVEFITPNRGDGAYGSKLTAMPSLGPSVGAQVLRFLAERIMRSFRPRSTPTTVSRFGSTFRSGTSTSH